MSDKPASLRTRLLVSFGLIILLMAALSGLVYSTVRTTYSFLSLVQENLFGIEALSGMAGTMHENVDNYLDSGKEDYLANYEKTLAEARKRVQSLSRRFSGELSYGADDIANMIETYDELKKLAVERFRGGLESIYVDKDSAELGRVQGYIQAECMKLLSEYMRSVDNQAARMAEDLKRSGFLSWILLFGATIASALLAWRVTYSISTPVHRLVDSLGHFAAGNLDIPPLTAGGSDEIGILTASFNDMTERIGKMVEEIKRTNALESELRDQEIRSLAMENALKQSRIETLFARINPHFLFNTLNTISTLASIEDAGRTQRATESLAELVRAQLQPVQSFVRLADEMQLLGHYLKIQEIRFGARIRYELSMSTGIEDFLVPGMVLQPFVENAVMHGLEPKEEGGTVSVTATLSQAGEEALEVHIRDDGIGFDLPADLFVPRSSEKGVAAGGSEIRAHEGIANVCRRLELVYGMRTVSIESAVGRGTIVSILFPRHPGRKPERESPALP